MTLSELNNGDLFMHFKTKSKKRFIVYGNSHFNFGHGSATRNCIDLSTKLIVGKSCRLEVKKTGESKSAEKIKKLFDNPKKVV